MTPSRRSPPGDTRSQGHHPVQAVHEAPAGTAPGLTASDAHSFSTDEAEVIHSGPAPRPFHRPLFLSTVIHLVRKGSHV